MSDSELRGVQAHPAPAAAQASAPGLSIEIAVHMWITWAELAIEHNRESLIARKSMMREYAKGGNYAVALGRETGEAVLAICSASFAMDALINVWARLVMEPAVVAKWESPGAKGPKIASRALEVFKRLVKDAAVASDLAQRWEVVFAQRNDVVHFAEEPGSPVPHPAGIGNTAEVNTVYCQENAAVAVDLLIATLAAITSAAKPKLRKWVADFSPTLEQLLDKRKAGL
jgi:hypothetical protein